MAELTTDQKLDQIEKLLLDSLLLKAQSGDDLNTTEMQLLLRWLKSRDPVGKPKKVAEPTVTKGIPLPFLTQKPTLEDTEEALLDQ